MAGYLGNSIVAGPHGDILAAARHQPTLLIADCCASGSGPTGSSRAPAGTLAGQGRRSRTLAATLATRLRISFLPRHQRAMSAAPLPSSEQLARYLEARGELDKPWMWHLLRIAKLKETQHTMPPHEYEECLRDAHADLMRLGEFWKGREAEVFGGRYQPSSLIEPLPGSPEDR